MSKISQQDKDRIWQSFGRAIGTEPRDSKKITGASGLEHSVQSISVDDKQKRVVVVVSEPNPRMAALMQTDIQAAIPDAHVLVARPVVIDFAAIARRVFSSADRAILDIPKVQAISGRIAKWPEKKRGKFVERHFVPSIAPFVNALNNVSLPGMAQLIDVIQQSAYLDWGSIKEQIESRTDGKAPISLSKMFEIDNLAIDRSHGVCPLPLYDFSEQDWEVLTRGVQIDDVQHRLKSLGIFQFFFPSPDQLALGMVEKGLSKKKEIIEVVERAPQLGHPLTGNSLVEEQASIPDVLEALRDRCGRRTWV